MAKELDFDDDFFLLELFSDKMGPDDENDPKSDVEYAQALQLEEALMASLVKSPNPGDPASASSMAQASSLKHQPEEPEHVTEGVGQPSLSFCEICVERKEHHQMFIVDSCKHSFCTDCISKYVEKTVTDSIHVVKCPAVDCEGVLEFDSCISVTPKDSLAKWNEALCRSLVLDSQKFYCPYKNCSAMLLRDTNEVIRESECPECRRLFCAQCYVPWHSGVGCEEFQKLNEDERGKEDIMLRELAKAKKWNRCPRCQFYIEKTEGCLHITCRCGFQFCYACGATWSSSHGGCQ